MYGGQFWSRSVASLQDCWHARSVSALSDAGGMAQQPALIQSPPTSPTRRTAALLFKGLDHDGDGFLTVEDLAPVLSERAPEEAARIMKALDPQDTGRVSLATWVSQFEIVPRHFSETAHPENAAKDRDTSPQHLKPGSKPTSPTPRMRASSSPKSTPQGHTRSHKSDMPAMLLTPIKQADPTLNSPQPAIPARALRSGGHQGIVRHRSKSDTVFQVIEEEQRAAMHGAVSSSSNTSGVKPEVKTDKPGPKRPSLSQPGSPPRGTLTTATSTTSLSSSAVTGRDSPKRQSIATVPETAVLQPSQPSSTSSLSSDHTALDSLSLPEDASPDQVFACFAGPKAYLTVSELLNALSRSLRRHLAIGEEHQLWQMLPKKGYGDQVSLTDFLKIVIHFATRSQTSSLRPPSSSMSADLSRRHPRSPSFGTTVSSLFSQRDNTTQRDSITQRDSLTGRDSLDGMYRAAIRVDAAEERVRRLKAKNKSWKEQCKRLDQESSEARAQLSDMRESYRKLSLEHKELQEALSQANQQLQQAEESLRAREDDVRIMGERLDMANMALAHSEQSARDSNRELGEAKAVLAGMQKYRVSEWRAERRERMEELKHIMAEKKAMQELSNAKQLVASLQMRVAYLTEKLRSMEQEEMSRASALPPSLPLTIPSPPEREELTLKNQMFTMGQDSSTDYYGDQHRSPATSAGLTVSASPRSAQVSPQSPSSPSRSPSHPQEPITATKRPSSPQHASPPSVPTLAFAPSSSPPHSPHSPPAGRPRAITSPPIRQGRPLVGQSRKLSPLPESPSASPQDHSPSRHFSQDSLPPTRSAPSSPNARALSHPLHSPPRTFMSSSAVSRRLSLNDMSTQTDVASQASQTSPRARSPPRTRSQPSVSTLSTLILSESVSEKSESERKDRADRHSERLLWLYGMLGAAIGSIIVGALFVHRRMHR